jgi:hypothetical protein
MLCRRAAAMLPAVAAKPACHNAALPGRNGCARRYGERSVSTSAGWVARRRVEDHFPSFDLVVVVRSRIERWVRQKYFYWPVEETGTVLLKTMDVEQLLQSSS